MHIWKYEIGYGLDTDCNYPSVVRGLGIPRSIRLNYEGSNSG